MSIVFICNACGLKDETGLNGTTTYCSQCDDQTEWAPTETLGGASEAEIIGLEATHLYGLVEVTGVHAVAGDGSVRSVNIEFTEANVSSLEGTSVSDVPVAKLEPLTSP